jgi:chorismate mutase
MQFRGIRGATTVDADTAEAIWAATRELLEAMIAANDIHEDDVASVIFTTTPDLSAAHPAKAARDMGWTDVALIGCMEMDVPNSVKMCVRILIHWNTPKRNAELRHIFMRNAVVLRPDLSTVRTDGKAVQ